jgi:hypothetical protein
MTDDDRWTQAVESFLRHCEGNGVNDTTLDGYRWQLTSGRALRFVSVTECRARRTSLATCWRPPSRSFEPKA